MTKFHCPDGSKEGHNWQDGTTVNQFVSEPKRCPDHEKAAAEKKSAKPAASATPEPKK